MIYLQVFFALACMVKAAIAFTKGTAVHHGIDRSIHLYAKDAGGSGGALSKAYNDDALFNFHMMTQAQKIRNYSAMDTYVNTASLWNLAWHDSFVRNGLADMVPPLTETLSVLVVGDQYQGPTTVGEIDGVGGDQMAAETEEEEKEAVDSMESLPSLQQAPQDSSCSFLAAVFEREINNENGSGEDGSESSSNELEFTTYDCIMDQGLMSDLLSASTDDSDNDRKNKEDMARLLQQSSLRLREMGVYVANTPPMSPKTKEYLSYLGEILGLQWEFDLDGISDDNKSVSVARKFGTCPTIGWQTMARLIKD